MIVECPRCGARNHLPDPPERGRKYRCGVCRAPLAALPRTSEARDEGDAAPLVAAAGRKSLGLAGPMALYLVTIVLAEVLVRLYGPAVGGIVYALLLIALVVQSRRAAGDTTRLFLLTLSLVPVINVLAAVVNLALFAVDVRSELVFLAIVFVLSLAAAIAMMRTTKLRAPDVAVAAGKPVPQLLVGLTGIAFGFVLYYLTKPDLIVAGADWRAVLAAVVVILIGAAMEELTFRGILQRTSWEAFGVWGLVYVSLVFGLIHIGRVSGVDLSVASIPWISAVALFYAWVVRKTGSLSGVTLSHFLNNIIVFLVGPLVLGM